MSDTTPEVLEVVPQIAVIRIVNPFDPRDHVRETLAWASDKTLADYFPLGCAQQMVSVNGKIVPAEQFGVTYLAPEDNLVVCPVPQGGGDKNILAMVAMIALAVVAAPLAAGLNASLGLGFAAGSTGMAMLTAGVTMAGSMLINSMFAPSKPTADTSGGGTTSTSYGVDGAKNTSVEGVPIPVLYGEFRMAGNIVNLHVENDGDTQFLYLRMVASEGQIAAIDSIEINDQPIGNYVGIETDVRLGTTDQPLMGWFADTIRPMSKGTKLTGDWTYHTTDSIDKFRVDLSAPGGLFGINEQDGSNYAVSVDFDIQYRPAGSGAGWTSVPGQSEQVGWREAIQSGRSYQNIPANHYYDASGILWGWVDATPGDWESTGGYRMWPSTPTWVWKDNGQAIADQGTIDYLNANHTGGYVSFGGETEIWTTPEGRAPVYGTVLRMTDSRRSAARKSFMSPQLARGAYEVRMRRVSADSTETSVSDDVYVSDVNEILLEDLVYPHTAMLGLRIRLSEQISSLPKVTFRALGKLVRVNRLPRNGSEPAGRNWYYEYSNNPAWIVWDMLTNNRYGGGMASARLDLAAFQAFADHCEAEGLSWNGPFDREMNVWDACQLPLRVGHAQLVGVGTRYTVVTEKAADPVMMFSVANMIEGTFKENWLPITDRANEVEVTFFDREDGYKQRTVKVYDPAALAAGRPQRNAAITLYGVVDHARAFKEGLFQLNLNRYILQTIEFAAPLEAIACTVGDLIYVQHDMPQWGFAGRFNAGSTASVVQLDREVTLEAGKQYKLLAMHDALQRASGSVVNVVGTSIFLAGYDGLASVKRLKFGSLDREVLGTFNQGGGAWGVVLADASGITAGGTYELWDTDVLEERDVVNTPGATQVLTLQSPLPQAPAQFVHWMFGEVGKYKKPFRVKSITGSHEYRRDITAIEYNASVYDLDGTPVPTPNYSSLAASVSQAVIEGVEESLFLQGGSFKSHVTVFFGSSQESYSRSAVYAAVNGGPFQLIAANALDRATIDLNDSDVVIFKVVARDVMGASAADHGAPTWTHTVVGKLAPPRDVTGLQIGIAPSSLVLKWSPNTDLDLAGYEIREGASWDQGALIVTNFAGTSYPVPKNQAGTYTFQIRAIDTGGRYSSSPTVASITLSPPAAVRAFDCVQNGERIEFRWDANKENYLVGYEIREGASWAIARKVAEVNATSYSMPSNSVPGARTFWIKARIEPGIESATAVFSTTDVAVASNRNLVYTDDQVAEGWLGSKYRMAPDSGTLLLQEGFGYGEYTWDVTLPKTYRARNSVTSDLGAVVLDNTSWAQAAWNWTQQQAERGWAVSGDLASVDVRYYITKYTGLDPAYLEGFSLHGTTTGENGTVAAQALGVSYAEGRFLQGARLGDFTRLNWNLALPAVFHTTLWVNPKSVAGNQVFWSAVTAAGLQLTCGYDAGQGAFYLEDTRGGRIAIARGLLVDDKVLIGIVQTAGTRRLHVGLLGGTASSASAALTPIGDLAAVRLHQ